jgi:hypothetical protein
LPQGSPKKIEFNLLLPHLAFQLGDPFASRSNILNRYAPAGLGQLMRPTRPP